MHLYGITELDVQQALSSPEEGPLTEGNRIVVIGRGQDKFKGMPLKVVCVMEEGLTVIVSVYPLKRKHWREDA